MPGSEDYIDKSWSIKKDIYENQNLLSQSRRFFRKTYRDGTDYIAVEYETTNVAGFGIITDDDYLAILGVKPTEQGNGIGSKIINDALLDDKSIHCHTRVTNQRAIDFYQDCGFVVRMIEENYYNDDTDAAVLEYQPNEDS